MDCISVLSNINLEMLKQILNKKYDIYTPPGYGDVIGELINKSSGFYNIRSEFCFILIDGSDEFSAYSECKSGKERLDEYIDVIEQAVIQNREKLFIIANMDIPQKRIGPVKTVRIERLLEAYWYDEISRLQSTYDNAVIFDLKNLIETCGREDFYSVKLWYMGSIPYSLNGMKLIAEEIDSILSSYKGKRLKCLAIDLDNTLWGGVIGEEGIEGILLSESKNGAIYYDLQKRIKELKDTGAILIILSKNNEEDVERVFNEHPHMVLKDNDFVCKAINWENKAENLFKLTKEINIGIDSVAFLDDNPVERDIMRNIAPDVTVIDFPNDITKLSDTLRDVYNKSFRAFELTDEDKKKTVVYKQELTRKSESKRFKSLDDYIKSLKIELDMHEIEDSEIERVSQLTQKTNQFNLTTKRYTVSDILEMKVTGHKIYTVHSKDKYGDSGLISVIIIKVGNDTAYIDTFLMSCRVMGRKIENAIIGRLCDELNKKGITTINAEFIRTAKNKPVECLYDDLGFNLVSENDAVKKYIANTDSICKYSLISFKG